MTGGKNRAFMLQLGTKYDTSPVEGREKEFFFYRLLYTEHSHLLNTAKEITHLLSTRNYKKNCSLWTPPIESP